MKTYFVSCVVKYKDFDELGFPVVEEEGYNYIIHALTKREAKENAVIMAQNDIKNEVPGLEEHPFDIVGVDIINCYQTTEDARL